MTSNNSFDTVIKAICPHCLKDMKITNKNETYCEECDFSWEGDL